MRGGEDRVVQSMDNVRHPRSRLLIELVDGIYAVATVGAPLEGLLTLGEEGAGERWGRWGPISGRLSVDGGGTRSRRNVAPTVDANPSIHLSRPSTYAVMWKDSIGGRMGQVDGRRRWKDDIAALNLLLSIVAPPCYVTHSKQCSR